MEKCYLDLLDFVQILITTYKYYIPSRIGVKSDNNTSDLVKAKRHFTAAISFAPYLSATSEIPSLSMDRAFLPENVHEAEYHLLKALEIVNIINDSKFRNNIYKSLNIIRRFADIQSWRTVGLLKKVAAKDAYDIASELIAESQSVDKIISPTALVNKARAAIEWSKYQREKDKPKSIKEELFLEIKSLYTEAERMCDYFKNESKVNRLIVLTDYAIFLEKHGKNKQDRSILKKLNKKAIELLNQGVDGSSVMAEWYEMLGDKEKDPSIAINYYQLGTKWVPEYYQNWLKLIGASYEYERNFEKAKTYINKLSQEEIIKMHSFFTRYQNNKIRKGQAIEPRFKVGFQLLSKVIT